MTTELLPNSDYNYGTLNRRDLMSLSTINNNDAPIRKFKQINTKRDWSTNLYNLDIDKTAPTKFGVFNHKIDFINKVDDIERTNPKLLHIKLNKPEYNLSKEGIEGSSPKCWTFKTTRTNFNPLEPKYNLPKVEEIPQEIPKFIRDNINIIDIDGARPRKYYKYDTRRDEFIPGSKPTKPYTRSTKYDNINYSDVTHDVFKTSRCVNPLDPVYEVKYRNGETYVHGNIEKSKPATVYPYVYNDPFNLKVDDIDGTCSGSKNRINKFTALNQNLNIKDISGAAVGSLKKGIVSNRHTNPIMPNYVLPGSSLYGNDNNPYGDKIVKDGQAILNQGHQRKAEVASLSNDTLPKSAEIKMENKQREVLGFNNQIYKEEP